MQRDIRPEQIDCVFSWGTSTGEVREGARDSKYNGKPVPYRPEAREIARGLHTSVDGRVCSHASLGFRLSDQGGISRMCCHISGSVTHPRLVPARTVQELRVLQDAARSAVLSGAAREWALGIVHAGEREWLAVHIAASAAVISSLARRVRAAWTLEITEAAGDRMDGSARSHGASLRFLDADGQLLEARIGDSRFSEHALPPAAAFETGPQNARLASDRDQLAYPDELATRTPSPSIATGPRSPR